MVVAVTGPHTVVGAITQSGVGTRPHALPALTGLRFIAALLVVLHHFTTIWRAGVAPLAVTHSSSMYANALLARTMRDGWIGVNLFFILSGFILTYTYLDGIGSWHGSYRAFYVARLARIYPLYLLALLVGLIPLLWHAYTISAPLLTIPATLTFTELWLPQPDVSWCGSGWSLAPEVFFYALFPLLALLVGRLSQRHLLLLLLSTWIATLVAASGYHGVGNSWIYEIRPLVRLPEFILGVAVGRLFVLRHTITVTLPRSDWLIALAGIGCISVLAGGTTIWPDLWLHVGLCDPVFALLIYALARGRGTLTRALSSRVMVTLGEASYALYLLHGPLWVLTTRLMGQPSTDAHATAATAIPLFVAFLVCATIIAMLAYVYIEQPTRRYIRQALR